MSKPNTIPEFLGIMLITIIAMSIIGVLIGTVSDKFKKKIKDNPNLNLKKEPLHIHKETNENNLNDKINNFDKIKFRISMMFYQFCFSDQTAKIFLEDNSMSENISKGLMVSRFQLQKINILESILKIYLKKNHRIELGEGSSGFYTINDYRFFIDTIRVTIEKNDSYFEILYNDFENVKDENGNEMSIAKEFILYVKNFKPQAIFVLVHDSILDKYALRRVTEEGVNFKLTFLKNNEGSESIDFLKDYILNNNL